MSSNNYNTRLNSLTSTEESTPTEVSASNDTIVDTPSQANSNTSQFSETATLIINLENWWKIRFDGLDNDLLNLKDVIIHGGNVLKIYIFSHTTNIFIKNIWLGLSLA